MKTIYKYQINLRDNGGKATFEIPEHSTIVAVGPEPSDRDNPNLVCLWAIVVDDLPKAARNFVVHGTGHPAESNAKYIGSVVIGKFAWHAFELMATNAQVST